MDFMASIDITARLLNVITRFIQWSDQHNLKEWVQSLEKGMDELEQAKTSDEKIKAVKSLARSISQL